jgi:hypothetical protein
MQASVRTSISSLIAAGVIAGLSVIFAERGFVVEPAAMSIDAIAIKLALSGGVYLALFGLAHLLLSRLKVTSWPLYIAAGAVAFLTTFQFTGGRVLVPMASENGMISLLYAVPVIWGAMMGFIYRRSAGVDAEGDDPHRLQAMLTGGPKTSIGGVRNAFLNGEPVAGFGRRSLVPAAPMVSEDAAHVATEAAEYYDGPLQVRTSAGAVLIAGLSAGIVWGIIEGLYFGSAGGKGLAQLFTQQGFLSFMAINLGAKAVLGLIALPVFIYIGHLVARSRGQTSYAGYALYGALVPIGIGLLMFVFGVVMMAAYAIPTAIAMLFYRYLAGLEPKALPEDVEVRDRRTLVGANHARRRYGRVIGR